MTWNQWGLFLALGVSASGCGRMLDMAPQSPASFWEPGLGVTTLWDRLDQEVQGDHHLVDTGPLSLFELVDYALQHSPVTKQSWMEARKQLAAYGESLSANYPELTLSSQFSRQKGTFVEGGGAVSYYSTVIGPDVNLSYTFWDFGRRSLQQKTALYSFYAAGYQHNSQIEGLLQQVLKNYYDFVYSMHLTEAKREDVYSSKKMLEAANIKWASGIVSLSDVMQARSQYLQTKIGLTKQEIVQETEKAALAETVGLPAYLDFEVVPFKEPKRPWRPSKELDHWIQTALHQRSDLLSKMSIWQSQIKQAEEKRAEYGPTLTGNLQSGKYWFNQGAEETTVHWSAEVKLSWSLFDGFSKRYALQKAQEEAIGRKLDVDQTWLQVTQEVTVAYKKLQRADEILFEARECVKASEVEFEAALLKYQEGVQSILDLISAQKTLADARALKSSALRDGYAAWTDLLHAVGALSGCEGRDLCGAIDS
jgi:outer membrane protein TolC